LEDAAMEEDASVGVPGLLGISRGGAAGKLVLAVIDIRLDGADALVATDIVVAAEVVVEGAATVVLVTLISSHVIIAEVFR